MHFDDAPAPGPLPAPLRDKVEHSIAEKRMALWEKQGEMYWLQ